MRTEGSRYSLRRQGLRTRNALRAILFEQQLTRTDISRLTGLSYPVVCRIVEADDSRLTQALRIATALGVQLKDLFWLEPTATEGNH